MKTLCDFASKNISQDKIQMIKYLCDCNDFIKDSHINVNNYFDTGYQYNKLTGIQECKWNQIYSVKQDNCEIHKVNVIENFNLVLGQHIIYDYDKDEESLKHKATLCSMSDKMCHDFIYGNNKIFGLAEHYNNLYTKESSRNVINAYNKNPYVKNSSIYLIIWDDNKVFTFIPKSEDVGFLCLESNIFDNETNTIEHRYNFEWKMGFAIQDWRYAGRICNIEVKNINASLVDQMCELMERIKSFQLGKPVWYMNRDVKAGLRKVIGNRNEIQYIPNAITQRPEMYFNEIPVHICDQIKNDENIVEI